jgi:hypothetical protein
MEQSIMMMNMPVNIGQRDIKREFKAAGYGSIDTIVFEPETFEGYNTVYVWFRPTTKERILQKRRDLQTNCGTYQNHIDICCDKTPRTENGCGDRWFLLPNEERAEPPVFSEKTQSQLNEMDFQIQHLSNKVEQQQQIIYQLLGGLFDGVAQEHVLDDYVSYLFDGTHKPVPSDEDNLPRTRQGDVLEKKVEKLQSKTEAIYQQNDTYERKMAAIEKRFELMERRVPSIQNDTYERKLAALEKRFDDCEFQLPVYPPPNDTYDRKLAALEKRFESLYTEMSNTASFVNKMDCRIRNAAHCLTTDL